MGSPAVDKAKADILRWLQQNNRQKPDGTTFPDEDVDTRFTQGQVPDNFVVGSSVDPDRVTANPITMRDVDRLLNEMAQDLLFSGAIDGDLDRNGNVTGAQARHAKDILAQVFLGGPVTQGISNQFIGFPILTQQLIRDATAVANETRRISQKFPASPTEARRRIDYIQAAKSAYVGSGLVTEEFWREAINGNSPTLEQSNFALSLQAGFSDAHQAMLLDSSLTDKEFDTFGRFLNVINENDIDPRLAGGQRDFDSFFAILPEEDTAIERRQLNAAAFDAEQQEAALKNPGQFLADNLGMTAAEILDPDTKQIFNLALASEKSKIIGQVKDLKAAGVDPDQIFAHIQASGQAFLDALPDTVTAGVEGLQADQRAEDFEKLNFSDIEKQIVERAKEETDFEIVAGSRAAQQLVNLIRESSAFEDFDPATGQLPDVAGFIDVLFDSGTAGRLASEEAEAEARLEAFEASDTFAEIEKQVRDLVPSDSELSDSAVSTIARRINDAITQAAASGAPLPDVRGMITDFISSGEAQRITFADAAEEAQRKAEAADLTEGSIDKAFRFAEASGLLDASASPEFRQHIEETFIRPAANALDVARVGDQNVNTDTVLQQFLDGLRADPAVDLTESRFKQRQFQQTDLAAGQVPTLVGGLGRAPLPVTVDPTAFQGSLFAQLGTDATPGFLNFLMGQEPGLLREFQQTQQPRVDQTLFDERTRMLSGITTPTGFAGLGPLEQQRARKFTPEQVRQLAARGAQVTPPTAAEFLGSRIPGLRQEFRESPGGIAEARSEEERVTREAETARLRAEQEVEQSQSRALRRGGRTVFSRIRG